MMVCHHHHYFHLILCHSHRKYIIQTKSFGHYRFSSHSACDTNRLSFLQFIIPNTTQCLSIYLMNNELLQKLFIGIINKIFKRLSSSSFSFSLSFTFSLIFKFSIHMPSSEIKIRPMIPEKINYNENTLVECFESKKNSFI